MILEVSVRRYFTYGRDMDCLEYVRAEIVQSAHRVGDDNKVYMPPFYALSGTVSGSMRVCGR